jgi:hypothetical protein
MKTIVTLRYRNQGVGMKKVEFMETWGLVYETGAGVAL